MTYGEASYQIRTAFRISEWLFRISERTFLDLGGRVHTWFHFDIRKYFGLLKSMFRISHFGWRFGYLKNFSDFYDALSYACGMRTLGWSEVGVCRWEFCNWEVKCSYISIRLIKVVSLWSLDTLFIHWKKSKTTVQLKRVSSLGWWGTVIARAR